MFPAWCWFGKQKLHPYKVLARGRKFEIKLARRKPKPPGQPSPFPDIKKPQKEKRLPPQPSMHRTLPGGVPPTMTKQMFSTSSQKPVLVIESGGLDFWKITAARFD